MIKQLRNRHFLFADLVLLPVAVYLSFILRLERLDIAPFWHGFAVYLPVTIVVIVGVFRFTGVYSRYWFYASIEELVLLTGSFTLANLMGTAISWIILQLPPFPTAFPRSVPFIFLLLGLAVVAGPRLTVRLLARYQRRRGSAPRGKPVLVMGAGDAGAMTVRELQNNPHLGIEVVGLLDDNRNKHGMRIHGVPVLGDRETIPLLAARYRVQQVIIAMPTAPGKAIRDIVALCEEASVQAKTIPGMYELLDGRVSVNQMRDVDIEDLLRREPVQTDIATVQAQLRGKRVLVTGGGGSIGSELCRQILRCRPAELIILGHGENSVFEIYHELRRMEAVETTLTPLIADIRFGERMEALFTQLRPEVVFHAAAHKHVPLMERNPAEAITNNVLGTRHLLAAAAASGVERFVLISTDKAVNPTSIMGASKRVAELLVHQTAQQTGRPYVAVRFGNVLGSRGSVVLTFKRQIANGGPVTVTDPEMKRYFMTIPEAVQLVLQAAVLGQGGEVFVLDMGKPVKILDLARDVIELSGLEVGRDVDIEIIGRRPGEKLFEELFVPGEKYARTAHEKVFIARNASSFVPNDLDEVVRTLAASAQRNDRIAIIRGLQALVPAYTPLAAEKQRDRTTTPSPPQARRGTGETAVSTNPA